MTEKETRPEASQTTDADQSQQNTEVEKDNQTIIKELLEARYPVTISTIAEMLGCTDLEAAQQLPEHMRTFAPGKDFEEIWQSAATWESATFLVLIEGNVIETCGKLPLGKFGQGYYNLLCGTAPLQGHIKVDKVKDIVFISIPFMGRESHCIAFMDETGMTMYSIYVGRKNHQLIESAKNAFLDLASSYR